MLKLSREFVCAADEVWQLDHFDDEGSTFFQDFFKKVPPAIWEGDANKTKQGTYIVTAEGDFLAGHFGRCSRENTLKLMREGLKKFQELAAQRGWNPKPVPVRDGGQTWTGSGVAAKAGGRLGEKAALILQVNSRDLPGSHVNKEYAYAWNQTWLEFNADEMRQFLPANGKSGQVSEGALAKFAKHALMDNVRGQTDGYDREQTKKLDLFGETLRVQGSLVTVRLQGAFDLDAGSRGYAGQLFGEAVFDQAANRFVRFELMAAGTRRGATQFNFRRNEGPSPLGICFTLEGQYDRPLPVQKAASAKAAPEMPEPADIPVRKAVSAETLAEWDAKLLARVKEEIAAGRKPGFELASMKTKVTVVHAGDNGRLTLNAGGAELSFDFKRLAAADKQSLALSIARQKEPGNCALAAFYLFHNGQDQKAQEFLGCAGEKRADILALFR